MKEEHPSTKLIERNLEHIKGQVLMVNPVELASVQAVLEGITQSQLSVSCQDYTLFKELKKQGLPAVFETHRSENASFDQAIVFLPKSDAEIEMVLLWASDTLKETGELILIGQNNAGIKSARKTLEKLIGPVTFSDAARHSALYIASKTIHLKPFSLDDHWQSYDLTLPSDLSPLPSLHIYSLPGVFSHGRLDEGTQLLLESFTESIQAKHILDWGSGAGGVGAYIATIRKEAKVDMVDSNALALESAQKTIDANSLANCKVLASSIFSDITDVYDCIVANPPFHKGHDTHYNDSEEFLTQAKDHLETHGTLRIVANIFLRYEQFLEERFGYVKVVNKTNKYKILETIKAPTATPRKRTKFKKKRTLEEAGFVDIRNLDDIDIAENL